MKKIPIILVLIGLFILFVGCSEDETHTFTNASRQNIDIAIQIVEITDEFLDGNITARNASSRIWNADTIVHSLTPRGNARDLANLEVAMYVSSLQVSLASYGAEGTTENLNTVIERRNNLAERLGIDAR